MNSMSDAELGWLAGLLEGEGWFSVHTQRRPNKDYRYPHLGLQMTDEDVVRRAAAIAGVGEVYGPISRGAYKDQWSWRVWNSQDATSLMQELLPLMGQRRQEKIRSILQERNGDG